ncbi:X-box-binding protein 1-like [Panonychus citri]|uniref:X-box-binding protein 1-like n=1 Tax=Panonychus citri TaxID=50023 RepID=UPI0023074E31|nr:X-box-binding protein 1-like [Panonychus citri]
MFVDSSLITGDECNGKRKRKREKLDHLTEEEKMMRRKIKNRLSAQTSRDKKKRVMSTLEIELASLGAVNKRLMQENGDLKKMLDQSESNQQRILSLEMENKFLKEKLDNLEKMIMNNNNNQKSSKSISDIDSSQSERSLDTSFEPAELINGSQQKNQEVNKILMIWTKLSIISLIVMVKISFLGYHLPPINFTKTTTSYPMILVSKMDLNPVEHFPDYFPKRKKLKETKKLWLLSGT